MNNTPRQFVRRGKRLGAGGVDIGGRAERRGKEIGEMRYEVKASTEEDGLHARPIRKGMATSLALNFNEGRQDRMK